MCIRDSLRTFSLVAWGAGVPAGASCAVAEGCSDCSFSAAGVVAGVSFCEEAVLACSTVGCSTGVESVDVGTDAVSVFV